MSVWITENEMSSNVTAHHATRLPPTDRGSSRVWRLSFLPVWWLLDRNQAITAMTLAETIATGDTGDTGDGGCFSVRDTALITDLAAELGMTAREAITRITTTETEDRNG